MSTSTTRVMRFRLVPVAMAELARHRIDGRALLDELCIPEAALTGAAYLPLRKVRDLLDACALLGREPLFGWQMASAVPLGTYGMNEFAMRTAGDLQSGIEAVCKYGSLVNGLTTFHAERDGGQVVFGFSVAGLPDAMGVQLNEYTMHYLLRVVRAFGDTRPTAVSFSHARASAQAEQLGASIGAPVTFGAARCVLTISADALGRRSPLSDDGLYRCLEEQLLASLERDVHDDIVRAVHDVLSARLGKQQPLELGAVARQLAMSTRSLQRRLEEADAPFSSVVDVVRQERARELILTPLSLQEIAARVGYREAAAFTRAFRRWTGVAPREYRRRSLG